LIFAFDCDGVLLDTNEPKVEAWRRTGNALGLDGDRLAEAQVQGFGKNRRAIADDAGVDPADYEELSARLDVAFDRVYDSCDATEGCRELISSMSAGSVAAIVSGAKLAGFVPALDRLGLLSSFAIVIDGTTPKRTALAALGHVGEPGYFFGDSSSDLVAARGAGWRFVFVSQYSVETAATRELLIRASSHCIQSLRDARTIVAAATV